MSSHLINSELQQTFAQLSGNFNRMYVDPIAARHLISELIEHAGENLCNLPGALELLLDTDATRKFFPKLIARLPHIQISEILATSRLVGLECQGLHSVFSELKLSCNEPEDDSLILRYHVKRFGERFGLTTIEVERPGVTSTIKAFLRPVHNQAPAPEILYHLRSFRNFDGKHSAIH